MLIAAAALAVVFSGASTGDPVSRIDPASSHVPGEVLVKFRTGAERRHVESLRSALGARRIRRFARGTEHLRLGPGRTTESAIRQLRNHPLVEYAEPNYIVNADVLPDDPRYAELWGLRNDGQTGGTPGADIDAEDAWEVTTGDRRVLVAVIDTGIDYTHPDLAPNIWTNPGEIPDNGIDDDGNGFVDDYRGWDFYNDDNDPMDDESHGSHVAGTIAAVGDNGIGVAGVSWKVSILPIKFLNHEGSGTLAGGIAAIEYATLMGADISNNSWSGGPFTQAMFDAIVAANESGMLFVASAGNFGLDNDIDPRYPSSYEVPNVVAVAATDHHDALAGFSNFGVASVDLAAPGVRILSTLDAGLYGLFSGTSMSSPHVSGAAALLLAAAPHLTVDQVKAAILDSVDPVPGLVGRVATGGRLNVGRLLARQDETPPRRIDDLEIVETHTNSLVLRWTAPGDDGDEGTAALYDIRYDTGPIDSTSFATSTRVTAAPEPSPPGSVEVFELGGLDAATSYHVALRAEDEWGNAGPVSNTVSEITLPPPTLGISPTALEVVVRITDIAGTALTVSNVGAGTLDWSISSDGGTEWLSVTPSSGRLRSGERADAEVTIDPATLVPGSYAGQLTLASNDPVNGERSVPVSLTVLGAPDIRLSGQPLVLESHRDYDDDGAVTEHSLTFTIPPPGDGVIELEANGDFGRDFEVATVVAEGVLVGALSETGTDCEPAIRTFPVDAATLASLIEDGVVEIDVRNSDDVGFFCVTNRHTVRLRYRGPTDTLDCGTVFAGGLVERAVVIDNLGTEPLEVTSVASDEAAFVPAFTQAVIGPGASQLLTVSFLPLVPGVFSGTLRITSLDPDTPVIEVSLAGTAIAAPVLEVAPGRLDSTLHVGGRETRTVSLANRGGNDLEVTLRATGPDPPFVLPRTTAAAIAPGATLDVEIVIGRAALTPGLHEAVVEVASNDPLAPLSVVPVTLEILGGPHLSVAGGMQTLISGREFFDTRAETEHDLFVVYPPAGDGTLWVGYEGDFSNTLEHATLLLEGVSWTTVASGVADDCVPLSEESIVPLDVLETAAFDDIVSIVLANSRRVDPLCERNRHDVRLTFPGLYAPVVFGSSFVHEPSVQSIVLTNAGTASLEITAITTDSPVFVPAISSRTLAAGESDEMEVTFTPAAPGRTDGQLVFASNDPDQPVLSIALTGEGKAPPVVQIDPGEVVATLWSGARIVRSLEVSNPGSADLELELIGVPPFATATLSSTLVASGGSSELAIAIDTRGLVPGHHEGIVEIATNDPLAPIAVVSVVLLVEAAPGLIVEGAPVLAESIVGFDPPAGITAHSLPVTETITGDSRLEVVVEGDFGDFNEVARISIEGSTLGTVGAGLSCGRTETVFPLSRTDLEAFAADGVVHVELRNGPDVDAVCNENAHTVRLVYPGTLDPLDHGEVFVGWSRTRSFVVHNVGSEPLEITIESPTPEFGVPVGAASVAPGATEVITTEFSPSAPGSFGAALEILSNDPRAPLTRLNLTGAGLDPPVIRPVPDALSVEINEGSAEGSSIVLFNDGGGPLEFSVTTEGEAIAGVAPVAGVVAEHLSTTIGVGIDASSLSPGTYDASIAVTSNDPARPRVAIEVDVTVLPRPSITVTPARLEFGPVFVGGEGRRTLEIANTGTLPLDVVSITSDAASVEAAPPDGAILPGENAHVEVTFVPTTAGALDARVEIRSDDPETPVVEIAAIGDALPPPVAAVEPGTLETTLPPRSEMRRSVRLRVSNSGESPLTWSRVASDGPGSDRSAGWVEQPKGDDSDRGAGALRVDREAAPDSFGYSFRDSDEPDGPVFEWFDIAAIGARVPLAEDDQNSEPLAIGFDFPFYGRSFDTVNVCSNGWLSFTSTRTSFSNPDTLPNTGYSVPENLLAPFWDDLDPRGAERITAYGDGSRFIVQFTGIDRFSSPAELTFQVELINDGRILFRYLTMNGLLESATIGLQNGSKSRGLLVSYNESYVHDRMVIELTPGWIAAVPSGGVVPPDGISDVEVILTTEFLDDGDHEATWTAGTDDPAHPELSVPVLVHAREIALDRIELAPRTIHAGTRTPWIRAALQLPPDYDPRDVVVATVSIDGTLFAEPDWHQIRDTNGDGVAEIVVKFDRHEVLRLFPVNGFVTVTITGEVEGRTWFTGAGTLRLVRPAE